MRTHLWLALLLFLPGCAAFQNAFHKPLTTPVDDAIAADGQPVDFSAAIAKGINHERAGQYDKARETYEKLLISHPQRPEAVHRLAVVADKQRRHPEAQALYTRVIQHDPQNAELFNDLGYSFFLSGQLPKAESALAKAVQLEPNNPRYRNNLGMALGHQGRIDDAFTQFRAAGSEADAHYNVAFIYAAQNDVEAAKGCFLGALAIDPTHAKASKALESFRRFEQNDGVPVDDEFTADGRRLVPYLETLDGAPDRSAMAHFQIQHEVDSALPGKHNIPGNREAGMATREMMNTSRNDHSMASSRE